jgi:hypothetical protein
MDNGELLIALSSLAADVGVGVGHDRAEIAIRFLFADPLQKGLKLRRIAEQLDSIVEPRQFGIGPDRVKLLVARLAERRAMLGFSALLPGSQVMLRDQVARNLALTERANGIILWRWMHAGNCTECACGH